MPGIVSTHLDDLPFEILCQILMFVSDLDHAIRLTRVSKKWKNAVKGMKALTIRSNPLSMEKGIDKIVHAFPRLETLCIQTTSDSMHFVTSFSGHPTLRRIICNSDYGLSGIFQCPQLTTLVLSELPLTETFDYGSDQSSSDAGSVPTRNLATVLRKIPRLQSLQIHSPSFWTRRAGPDSMHSHLRQLRLLGTDPSFIESITQWMMEADTQGRFPNLELLYLDMDYSHLSRELIQSIAKGCPSLKILKIRFAIIPEDVIHAMTANLQTLEFLSLGQCKLSFPSNRWSDLTFFLLNHLSHLSSIHVNGCNINLEDGRYPFIESCDTGTFDRVESFKLFDVSNYRMDLDETYSVLKAFPALIALRMDVPAAFSLPKSLRFVKRLELRYSKRGELPEDEFNNAVAIQEQGCNYINSLYSLSLWSPFVFPDTIIRTNAYNLTTICINYPIVGPGETLNGEIFEVEPFELPNLKELEIRGLSILAHSICTKAINQFTRKPLPNLRRLYIDALHREEDVLDSATFDQLVRNVPNLHLLHTTGFCFPDNAFNRLSKCWPLLQTLVIRGTYSRFVTESWLENDLYPFLENHRHLRNFSMTVKSLNLPTFDFFNTSLATLKISDDEMENRKLAKNLYDSIFVLLSRNLTEKFWWISDCSIQGRVMH